MQKRLVLVCDDSLCPRKQPDVSRPGLGEAGRYIGPPYKVKSDRFAVLTVKRPLISLSHRSVINGSWIIYMMMVTWNCDLILHHVYSS